MFIVIAIGATLLWAGSTRQPLKFPYVIGIGIMVIAGCLAALFGEYPHAGILAIVIDLFLLGLGHNGGQRGPDRCRGRVPGTRVVRDRQRMGGGLAGVHRSSRGHLRLVRRAGRASPSGEQNGAGLYFALTILVILAGRWPRRLWWRVPVIGCLLLDLLLTGSLAGITGLLAGVALALVVRTAARSGGAAALVLLLVLTVAGGGHLRGDAPRPGGGTSAEQSEPLLRDSIGREQQSAWERQTITQETLQLWRTSTVLGLGPGATKSTLLRQQAPYPKEAHDDWTASLVEGGVLGFTGLLLLVGEIDRAGVQGRKPPAARAWSVRRVARS